MVLTLSARLFCSARKNNGGVLSEESKGFFSPAPRSVSGRRHAAPRVCHFCFTTGTSEHNVVGARRRPDWPGAHEAGWRGESRRKRKVLQKKARITRTGRIGRVGRIRAGTAGRRHKGLGVDG
ncbi:hypothetical protein PICMEDRAFT_121754 [Pichia membranifaciens NRRL Y-2026]|uniref:Uncharacterized protein n=1 Tax=Pichia membranifaciens NRRL Y-2026 TaxID=763406 RepID=A0A1E3NQW0_9ASCO|nr:hypothetical protein PICMEDRAFT_121754 [Pichia membranifaciens NRRL Y-2026]ODQ47963.1 hypothetical protein PICMEDRAFT_121754 [Pichia membranifaciens NRRL Y-2026]